MSDYSFVAANLKGLYNSKFQIFNLGLRRNVDFVIPDENSASRRQGTEGYGIRIVCQHPGLGPIRSFMKIFNADVPERHPRTDFLIRLGLAAKHPWMFQGVPYAWVHRMSINGIEVVGHVAKDLGGQSGSAAEDFQRLKSNDKWDASYAPMQRKLFAGQLCVAVSTMEQVPQGLVHGDLSAGNIMIGPGPDGTPVCCLCDFDGFYHPNVGPLPRVFGNQDLRPLGTAGYQYPELLARIEKERQTGRKDQDTLVQTDRFALAALVCELVIWNPDLASKLGRDQLLSLDDIVARRLPNLPAQHANVWPAGLSLLQKTLSAKDIADMPTPEDWLNVLGAPLFPHKSFASRPYLEIFKKQGQVRTRYNHAEIPGDKIGNLGNIHKDLAQINFTFTNGLLYFDFAAGLPVFRRRGGRSSMVTNPRRIEVSPGDSLSSNFWEIDFHDGVASL
jgi:hypothetical protein